MYIDKSLREYIDLTSRKLPAPGGGSVLALVGSLGIGLSQMAMNFTVDKEDFKSLPREDQEKIFAKLGQLEDFKEELESLIDLDSLAFNSVLDAYKLDKDNESRPRLIEEGYKKALEVPLRCFDYAKKALELEYLLSKYGDKGLITDTAIGGILSYAAMEGSVYNIKINLKFIKDESYKNKILGMLEPSLKEGEKYRDLILAIADRKL